MDRRDAIKTLSLGTLAASFVMTGCEQVPKEAGQQHKFWKYVTDDVIEKWENQFFNEHEFEMVRQLSNLIIPPMIGPVTPRKPVCRNLLILPCSISRRNRRLSEVDFSGWLCSAASNLIKNSSTVRWMSKRKCWIKLLIPRSLSPGWRRGLLFLTNSVT